MGLSVSRDYCTRLNYDLSAADASFQEALWGDVREVCQDTLWVSCGGDNPPGDTACDSYKISLPVEAPAPTARPTDAADWLAVIHTLNILHTKCTVCDECHARTVRTWAHKVVDLVIRDIQTDGFACDNECVSQPKDTCFVSGSSHIHTFDRLNYHFMSPCQYFYVHPCAVGGAVSYDRRNVVGMPFTVSASHVDDCYGSAGDSSCIHTIYMASACINGHLWSTGGDFSWACVCSLCCACTRCDDP